MNPKIINSSCRIERFPLNQPYHLAFGTLEFFESIQVTLRFDDGRSKTAEVVPLNGYATETDHEIWANVQQISGLAKGRTSSEFHNWLSVNNDYGNFSKTAFLTAIDLMNYQMESLPELLGLPTIVPTSIDDPKGIEDLISASVEPCTIKVKLSGDWEKDLTVVSQISKLNVPHLRFRLDANQAYNVVSASKFVSGLVQLPIMSQIDYLEQPLPLTDWQGQETLCREFPRMNFMMDESIFSDEDICRASRIKVQFVKLKLFKQGGVFDLIRQAKLANEQNLQVVLGNGVATMLSNQIEMSAYHQYPFYFYGAHEANGYKKVKGLNHLVQE